MDHRNALNKMDALIDGELAGGERLEVLHHFEFCEDCRREYKAALNLHMLCSTLPQQPLPRGFEQRLADRIAAEADEEEFVTDIQRQTASGPAQEEKKPGLFDTLMNLFRPRNLALALVTVLVIVVGALAYFKYIAPQPAPGQKPQMVLAYGDASVKVFDSDKKDWKSKQQATSLGAGSKLKTDNSKAVLLLGENNSIRLGPKTEVEISQVAQKGGKAVSVVKLAKGRVWIDEKSAANIRVETPGYLVKPIGTSYEVFKFGDFKDGVFCYEGNVEVELKDAQKTVGLDAGEKFISRKEKDKNEYARSIDKIDSKRMEKNEWYQWNRKLKSKAPPKQGEKLQEPQLAPTPGPAPPWFRQQRRLKTRPLMLPRDPKKWSEFKKRREKWRKRIINQLEELGLDRSKLNAKFAAMPKDQRVNIIKALKVRGKLPENYPEDAKKLTKDAQDELILQRLQKMMRKSGMKPGMMPKKRRDFSQLPANVRKRIIRHLKKRKMLPKNYSEDARDLPKETRQKLFQERMQRMMNRRGGRSPGGHFARLPKQRRVKIIRMLKSKGKLPPNYSEDAATLPMEARKYLIKQVQERIKNRGNQPTFPRTGGGARTGSGARRSGGNFFARLPKQKRVKLIRHLKKKGVLKQSFSEDATELPDNAKRELQKMIREQMRRRRNNRGPQLVKPLPPGSTGTTGGIRRPRWNAGSPGATRSTGGSISQQNIEMAKRRFANSPPRARKRVIKFLKANGKLPGTYPDNAATIPDDAAKFLVEFRMQRMKNRGVGPGGGFRRGRGFR